MNNKNKVGIDFCQVEYSSELVQELGFWSEQLSLEMELVQLALELVTL